MGSELLLIIVIVAALVFDFTNGFHDAANAVATSVATGALKPKAAVALSAALNLVGAFISIKVAATIAKGVVDSGAVTLNVVFAALIGAILWNLVTWALSLPSSSSHALIGGVVGATIAASGSSAVKWHGLISKVIVPALASPLIAGLAALLGTFWVYRLIRRLRGGEARRGYRLGQIGSASLLSLAHGTNDAQKTMGVITLALIANGDISSHHFAVPLWVKLGCGLAIGLGTYAGGWRIINTMGNRLTRLEAPQGFSSGASSATVILASSYFGYPLSTTQVVSGSVIGSGIGKRLASVHWRTAGQMVGGWVLTIPAAALIGGLAWEAANLFSAGSAGTIVVGICSAAGAAALYAFVQRTSPVHASDLDRSDAALEDGDRIAAPATVTAGA
jgi:inorganic phosphate transporter, PiT family